MADCLFLSTLPGSGRCTAHGNNFFETPLYDLEIQGLTLSGTGQDIFIPLSLLDQILSADFFSKVSKLFWR